MPSHPNGPDHPTVIAMQDKWFKLFAIYMHKIGATNILITEQDIDNFPPDKTIVVQDNKEGIRIRLVSNAEAARLQKIHSN